MERLISALTRQDSLSLIVTALLILSIPLILHLFIYRSSSSSFLPSFLLVGPSGSGKTALLTLFETGKSAATRISQVPSSAECSLPLNSVAASSKYRSRNDPSNEIHKKFLLADTPGHGKLRHYATNSIVSPQNLVGIIFMVDAAEIADDTARTTSPSSLQQTSELLHDILYLVQTQHSSQNGATRAKGMPVLIAANKQDLFTAFPAPLVKATLEKELTKIRNSRSRGLLDSGVGMNELGEEKELLGDGAQEAFAFSQLEEFGISVQVLGGSVVTSDKPDVQQWWDWIGQHL